MGSFNVKAGGQWRPAKGVHVKANGVWQAGKEVWVKAGGVWRKAWSARTVSIYQADYQQVIVGFGSGSYHDRITFGIQVSDGTVPTSYNWPSLASASATATFDGPTYNVNGFTRTAYDTVYATVVVAGQTYEVSFDFQYTAGDDA